MLSAPFGWYYATVAITNALHPRRWLDKAQTRFGRGKSSSSPLGVSSGPHWDERKVTALLVEGEVLERAPLSTGVKRDDREARLGELAG